MPDGLPTALEQLEQSIKDAERRGRRYVIVQALSVDEARALVDAVNGVRYGATA